jgi:hypothetical protein
VGDLKMSLYIDDFLENSSEKICDSEFRAKVVV